MRAIALRIGLLVVALAAGLPAGAAPARPAGAPHAAAASDACAWGYYPGGGGALTPLRSDADATPPGNLRLGSLYGAGAGPAVQRGAIDFDGDGRGDIFRLAPRPDGLYQWQYSSAGSGAWADLSYADTSLGDLIPGDFDGDGRTDLLTFSLDTGGAGPSYYWLLSSGGTGAYTPAYFTPSFPTPALAGDFDGDGAADVLVTTRFGDVYYWSYVSIKKTDGASLAYATVPPSDLRVGDFDGDGKSDVFASLPQGDGSYQWVFSSGGAAGFANLALTTHPVGDLSFGDFDGDGTTDVFALAPRADGQADWLLWPGGRGQPATLRTGAPVNPSVGDFDGDGRADIFADGCAPSPRLARLPDRPLANVATNDASTLLLGDVDGDGRKDAILSSLCQAAALSCASAENHVAVAPADGRGGFGAAAGQVLDKARSWEGFQSFAGNVDGDGRADLIFVNPLDTANGSGLSVYTASGGAAGFTLSGRIALGAGPPGANILPGDFNGDGRTDLVFTTVCAVPSDTEFDGCALSDVNLFVIALNNGASYVLKAQQSSSTGGWKSYRVRVGDVNGDGRSDLIWYSTCQTTTAGCDAGDANIVIVGLADSSGTLTLSDRQFYGISGWKDYSAVVSGDFNGDGRTDMAWFAPCPGSQHCDASEGLVRVGLANADGTFQVSAVQSLGLGDWKAWKFGRGDTDGDGRAELLWWRVTAGAPANREVRVGPVGDTGGVALRPLERFASGQPNSAPSSFGDITGDGRTELLWYGRGAVEGIRSSAPAGHTAALPLVVR